MKKTTSSDGQTDNLATLRLKAEEKLRTQLERLQKLFGQDIQKLVHELGTYQIKLEMENKELRTSRDELESSRNVTNEIPLYPHSARGADPACARRPYGRSR